LRHSTFLAEVADVLGKILLQV